MLYRFLNSSIAALLGCAIFGLSTIHLDSIEFISNSHILFCFAFMLFLFYSVYLYAQTDNPKWKIAGLVIAFLTPFTFAIGLLAGFWVILFFLLCIPKIYKSDFKKKINILTFPLLGWLLSVVVYIFYLKQIINAPHYRGVGYNSMLEAFNLGAGLILSFKALFLYLIPHICFSKFFSYFLFLAFFVCLIRNFRHIHHRFILFCLLWIIGNYWAVLSFRLPWGNNVIYWQRYHLFPAFGLASCYATAFCFFCEKKFKKFDLKYVSFIIFIVFIFICINTWYNYKLVTRSIVNTNTWNKFYHEFKDALVKYCEIKYKTLSKPIFLKDKNVLLPMYPLARPLKHYATFILPPKIKNCISWGDITEKEFLEFLLENRTQYSIFIKLLKNGGYDIGS